MIIGMRRTLLIGMCLGLAACAPTVYVKANGTDQEFQADLFDCEARVGAMYGGRNQTEPGIAIMAAMDVRRCIETKGWHKATAQDVAAQLKR